MTEPTIRMAYSDDGGYTLSNWRQRDGTGLQFREYEWRRLGTTKHRVYVFETTAPFKITLIAAAVK